MFKEDDRCHRPPGAPVSCPGAQLAFYPPLLCHRFVLLRIFGPFFEPHIFALFPGQLRAGSEKGAERGRHGDEGDIIGRSGAKNKIVPGTSLSLSFPFIDFIEIEQNFKGKVLEMSSD